MPDIEPTPPEAAVLFGSRQELATRYAKLLVTDGVERGLIGPRESDRIWTRHVLNCAAVAEAFPAEVRIVDVGSGAGLPGLVLAIARPDLRVDLVEPLARRAQFLIEAVTLLDLESQVRVLRGRAEERTIRESAGSAQWVTARAVAPLDRLVGWCLPLLGTGGRLVAMKGSSAAAEVAEHRSTLVRLGASKIDVVEYGVGVVDPPVTVVVIERGSGSRRPSRQAEPGSAMKGKS